MWIVSLAVSLGFWACSPHRGEWPAVEISPWLPLEEALNRWPELRRRVFRSSDAHYPQEVGRAWTELYLREPSFLELSLVLWGEGGRLVRPSPPYKEA
ncbi:MAG: PHP-associated domain-containing protein [Candidatus Bipolaricaulaceae bacterium]